MSDSVINIDFADVVTGTVVSLLVCLREFFSNVSLGMRGIKALIWEPSVLDAEEGMFASVRRIPLTDSQVSDSVA